MPVSCRDESRDGGRVATGTRQPATQSPAYQIATSVTRFPASGEGCWPVAERCTAVVSEGSERDRLVNAMAAKMPNFAEYQKATTRIIPVVVTERV